MHLKGIFTADYARRRLANLSGSMNDELDKFTVKKFYKVDLQSNPTLGLVSRILDIAPYVVVVNTDKSNIETPIGVITSEYLLNYTLSKVPKQLNGN